ncbi:acetyl/propionyl/methylcrotonyl-CoA carboxylase subunit alpha [Alcaligenaceae bacterium]|nr:acetyl/propionyl/methylcrotonyl-CoA carboxylase subunit alpha [Alcaligenaceae bacterium]
MFTTLLIANRGEIACRVAATARRMGLRTVAVYSDADATARHVAACDSAVHIGGPEPRESYLRGDAILAAARQTGAQAIHPGYGFLSENEGFAQACADAGIVFVGPPNSAIAAMGSKSAAKTLMDKAGVPLVPGYHGDNQDPQFLQDQADAMGYPVLIKASAGGGGKGMRIVESSADFEAALASCQREAASSFGDDKVLIERYLQKPRHIEIQVFADTHGNAVYLFERDCSVQRRHQKVIEEAPAPGMTEARRRAMGEAAVAAARAVNYVGAGTVEFIVEPDGRFYFMEMNTRLQVEHPVTEMITGHDLVEWQLRVAAGEALPVTQAELAITGHAIEARIYAENPDNGFLPSIGTLAALNFPPHSAFRNADIRVDGGVQAGDSISPYYDPMIAKLIVHGADREQARARMVQALGQVQAVGVQTNIAFLRRLMLDSAFASADLDTGLIARRHDSLFPPVEPAPGRILALAVAGLQAQRGLRHSRLLQNAAAADPWAQRDGWRIAGTYEQTTTLLDGEFAHDVSIKRDGATWALAHGDSTQTLEWDAQAVDAAQYQLRIRLDGGDASGTIIFRGEDIHVFADGIVRVLKVHDPVEHAQDAAGAHGGGLTAPMPGKIIAIAVKPGDAVKSGQTLLVMEAMKMEHAIMAPTDGTVEEIFFEVGDQVADGAELASLTD